LCIEEHGEICLLLGMMLGKDFEVSHLSDKGQVADYLRARRPVLVLIENNFFENDGLTYAAELKTAQFEQAVYPIGIRFGFRYPYAIK
jgi:PleD family two-component response regulator